MVYIRFSDERTLRAIALRNPSPPVDDDYVSSHMSQSTSPICPAEGL
jgi:hypothetical protein